MARLQELNEYKFTIINRLLESEDLCKALHYADTDFRNKETIADPSSLVYTNIFPHRFIPDLNETKQTYITVHFRRFQLANNGFKNGLICINIFTHRDLFKTDYGCTRIDYLLNKIDELFNQKRGVGIGKLEFHEMDEIAINDKYQGAFICYKPIDFN
ncbi:hypothetical protein GCM10023310_71060 [Paenibacillus vulneris]|uniref:Uncharacterized protein n=1 Tax=Paenibacillus vulneris TaxID=1133364 RepID=A0ABW3UEW9_9BACL